MRHFFSKAPFFFASVIFCSGILLVSCRDKAANKEAFFPILPYLQSEVKNVDTSMFAIIKIIGIDSSRIDTVYISRENFEAEAIEFLTLPDISSGKLKDLYTEEKTFDEQLQRAVFSYKPKKNKELFIQNAQVLISPSPDGDKVKNFIFETKKNTADSAVLKKMLWVIGKSFQVNTITTYKNQSPKFTSYTVLWE